MADNQIAAISEETAAGLAGLITLNLSSNALEKLPSWMFKMKNLELLSLGGNRISEIPVEIRNVRSFCGRLV